MTARMPSSESIEPAFFALRELFTGPLRGVSFPGVDASTVTELVDEAERRLERVAAARAAFADAHRELIAAESALSEQQTTLLAKSHVAIAYARVFAQEDQPDLLESIDRIVLPKARAGSPATQAPQAPKAARRGRPPKQATHATATPQVALPAAADEVAAE
ncbi:MAG: hypothetical protein HOV80_30720 [Polyangiaceae bacterium]|nr:hypothetical protein [Polyangiaceae bacterium]